jgi:hypothetical protein
MCADKHDSDRGKGTGGGGGGVTGHVGRRVAARLQQTLRDGEGGGFGGTPVTGNGGPKGNGGSSSKRKEIDAGGGVGHGLMSGSKRRALEAQRKREVLH